MVTHVGSMGRVPTYSCMVLSVAMGGVSGQHGLDRRGRVQTHGESSVSASTAKRMWYLDVCLYHHSHRGGFARLICVDYVRVCRVKGPLYRTYIRYIYSCIQLYLNLHDLI